MKQIFSSLLSFIICIITVSRAHSQTEVVKCDSLLSDSLLIADLDSLYQTIITSHPTPGGFISEEQFKKEYERIRGSIQGPMTTLEFALLAGELVGTMHDSHTSADYGQLLEWSIQAHGYVLPINTFYENGSYRIRNTWEKDAYNGWILRTFNGKDISTIERPLNMLACIEGDAYLPQQRIKDAIFSLVASIYIGADSVNTIEVENPETRQLTSVTLKGYTKKEYQAKRKERLKLPENKSLDLAYSASGKTAYLKIGTFAPSNPSHYRRFIKKSFRSINRAGCDSLIMDIRDNGGGNSNNVEYLYSFLDTAGYNSPANIIALNSPLARKRSQFLVKPFSQFILRTFFKKNEDIATFIQMMNTPIGTKDTLYYSKPVIQKRSLVFQGHCSLLISGLTASAGVDFTHHFREMNRGLIYGENCLGPMTGTWGNAAAYTLPNTKMRLSISTIRYNYHNDFKYEARPIEPDVKISPSSKTSMAKQDPVLQYLKFVRKPE